jgi:hypothetical protein
MTKPAFQYLYDEGRFGAFFIHSDRLFDESTAHVIRNCVVVKAERDFRFHDAVRYEVFHPDMEPSPMGVSIPTYLACLDSGGKLVFLSESPKHFAEIPEGWVNLRSRKRRDD